MRWPYLVLPVVLFARATESNPHDAQPERPSVATHAWTVAPGWIEIEAGTEFDRYDDHAHGETAPLVHSRGLHAAAGDLLVGVKWRAVEHAPGVATLAVFPTIKFPTGSTASDAGTGTTDLGVVLISSREFGSVSLDLNAGFTHRMGDDNFAPHNSSVWAVSFGGPAYGSLGWSRSCTDIHRHPAEGPQPRAIYADAVYNIGHLGRAH